jgi:hypothetical protein
MGKHFELTIAAGEFHFAPRSDAVAREAELDGLYLIRTSESQARISPEQIMRSDKCWFARELRASALDVACRLASLIDATEGCLDQPGPAQRRH